MMFIICIHICIIFMDVDVHVYDCVCGLYGMISRVISRLTGFHC